MSNRRRLAEGRFSLSGGDSQLLNRSSREPSGAEIVLEVRRHSSGPRDGNWEDLSMLIRVGYELIYECPQPTPMILTLNIHFTRASDIAIPDVMTIDPPVPVNAYRDGFGNWCTRIVAPQGRMRIATTGVVRDSGEPDEIAVSAP
jgi:hypothetical protein